VTYRLGQKVRIDGGQYHGIIGVYQAKLTVGHRIMLPGWGYVEVFRVVDPFANGIEVVS